MSADERWITVPNWEQFQNYGLGYRPKWIKLYTELLHKDEYMDLSLEARALLHGIWLAYADRKGRLRVCDVGNALGIVRRRGYRSDLEVRYLESLNQAGFIGFSESKPLTLNLEVGTEQSSVPTSTTRAQKKTGERDLLRRALDVAADWEGGDSAAFDDALDSLEHDLHARLSPSQRSRLWDEALRRDRRTPK